MLDGALEQRQRLPGFVATQIRVCKIDLMARVFFRELVRAMREVRLERDDRFGPLRGVVPVFPEQQLRVVALRFFDDDLLEPPIRPTFLDHIEVDTVGSSSLSTWLKISINYPSVQYTVGRVLK